MNKNSLLFLCLVCCFVTACWNAPKADEANSKAHTVQVSPDGRGDYPNIASAIRGVPAGSVIELQPGTYKLESTLIITKPIRLIGSGMDETYIISIEGDVAEFNGDGPFIVEDITFRNEGVVSADIVSVNAGEIAFLRCRFIGGMSETIGISGAGLAIRGKTAGTVRNCQIVQNLGSGVNVSDEAQPLLEGNTISENDTGIVYFGKSGGTATLNTISQNYRGGILVLQESQPTLRRNKCVANQSFGIGYGGKAAGVAEENECTGSEDGFSILGEALYCAPKTGHFLTIC
jgi:parallel beta-helix repeat protein